MDEVNLVQQDSARSSIAGFWRRVLAAFIDSIILGIVGWLLGLFLSDVFMHLGGWGRLVGFTVALFYFTLMNSVIFGGQTVGKRAAGIKVTDGSGKLLGARRSCVRYVILGIPFFLNGALIPQTLIFSGIGILISLAIFGLGFSIAYLFVFNRRTRQSLHDLIVGSYVVRAGQEQLPAPRMWNGHYIVVAFILIFSAVIPFVARGLAKKPFFKDILTAYEAITLEPEITAAQVMVGQTFFWDQKTGRTARTQISAIIRVNQRIEDKAAEAEKIARIILEKFPDAKSKNSIYINVIEGYDIGIASWSAGQAYNYSPQEWKNRIDTFSGVQVAPTPRPPAK